MGAGAAPGWRQGHARTPEIGRGFPPSIRVGNRTRVGGGAPSPLRAAAGNLTGVSGDSHKLTLGLLTVAGVSFAIMQTLVIPSLPFFVTEFDTSAAWVTWMVTSFLVSSSVLTPILGKLGDAHATPPGRRARAHPRGYSGGWNLPIAKVAPSGSRITASRT